LKPLLALEHGLYKELTMFVEPLRQF
jgi:hypothetical protein